MPTHLQSVLRRYFNPLPPHGGRLVCVETYACFLAFQSTPSTRRETVSKECAKKYEKAISIHSLHTEGDGLRVVITILLTVFQSTPSTRRETERNWSEIPP